MAQHTMQRLSSGEFFDRNEIQKLWGAVCHREFEPTIDKSTLVVETCPDLSCLCESQIVGIVGRDCRGRGVAV